MSKVLPSSQTDGSEFDAASSSQGVPSAEFDGTVLRGRIIGGDQSSHHTHPASDIVSGTMATARLGSGSASTTTFLRGDSTWATPADLDQQTLSISGQTLSISNGNSVTLPDEDTTYSVFTTTTDGLVPKPDGVGETGRFLKGDGTWSDPALNDTNTTYDLSTLTDSGAVKVRLAGSDSTDDDVTIAGSGAASVSQTGSTITVSSDAEVNVQSDWNQSTNTEDDFIKNKPNVQYTSAIPDATASQTGLATSTQITKLDGLVSNATHTGDATGATALTVVKLRGRDISTTAPSDGEVLKWSSTSNAWEPSADNNSGGGGGGSGHTIQNEGSAMEPRTNLDFAGELAGVTDHNSSTDTTRVTIDAKTAWLYG